MLGMNRTRDSVLKFSSLARSLSGRAISECESCGAESPTPL